MVFPAKAGSWAYPQELGLDLRRNAEGRPGLKKGYLFPEQGRHELPAPIPEKGPDSPQGGCHFRPVDRFPPAPLPPFGRSRFQFDRLASVMRKVSFPQ
jgi:hypothetical protein